METFQFARGGNPWKHIYLVNPIADNEPLQHHVDWRAAHEATAGQSRYTGGSADRESRFPVMS